MKEKYYLYDILKDEKNLFIINSYFINEIYNDNLYKKIMKINNNISKKQKNLFKLAYNKNWYQIENIELNKIKKTIQKLEKDKCQY